MKTPPFAAARTALQAWGERFAAMGDALAAARAEEAAAAELRNALHAPGTVNRMVYFSVLVQVRPGAPDHEVIEAAADHMRSVPDVLEVYADRVSEEPADDE